MDSVCISGCCLCWRVTGPLLGIPAKILIPSDEGLGCGLALGQKITWEPNALKPSSWWPTGILPPSVCVLVLSLCSAHFTSFMSWSKKSRLVVKVPREQNSLKLLSMPQLSSCFSACYCTFNVSDALFHRRSCCNFTIYIIPVIASRVFHPLFSCSSIQRPNLLQGCQWGFRGLRIENGACEKTKRKQIRNISIILSTFTEHTGGQGGIAQGCCAVRDLARSPAAHARPTISFKIICGNRIWPAAN